MELNYFTCTLGHAALLNGGPGPFSSVVQLIEEQARVQPESPALGFADFNSSRKAVTFGELHKLSLGASRFISCIESHKPTVALLCYSSIDFVVTWLGLMRRGHVVLFLSPHLDSDAIQHLLKELDIELVFAGPGIKAKLDVDVIEICPWQQLQLDPIPDNTISDIAYICHSSGTTSGVPKPIVQTQSGVVGCLPRFLGCHPATFSTTPLYHGGLPDCLRAWTSGAMIWFFPEGVMPMTGANIAEAVRFAGPVKYFSSVPYVLQMCEAELLRTMDLVGVGGAAMPVDLGDDLVAQGVKLLSRMGSAECGFLMSSHRDYATDKDWQCLRPINDESFLEFQPRDGLFELVVRQKWPFKPRDNYATADLFEKQPKGWRYHSRADSQIALSNGKKFDPCPIEVNILGSTKLRDVLVFGSGRPCAGALLFSDGDSVETAWPAIDRVNQSQPSHARISKAMLVMMRDQSPIPKSSKGTILRGKAEEKYQDTINSAYDSSGSRQLSSSEVLNCFETVLGRHIDPDEDLYRQGVDSMACIQIRNMIQPSCPSPLPLNIIYDQGTVSALVGYLAGAKRESELELMERLAKKYSHFDAPGSGHGDAVVLTGATGFLGAHILQTLRDRGRKVYCLVRAETEEVAESRLRKSMSAYGLSASAICIPYSSQWPEAFPDAAVFVHCAWSVNFNIGLSSFEDQIAGLRDLINLAGKSNSRFVFISSTASVSASLGPVLETISSDPSAASPLGYSRSKWVAERVCAASKHVRCSIIRVGQLCGNERGVWSSTEAYPLMLSTGLGLPAITDALDWLPVEVAARAVVDIVDNQTRPVYHVLNPHQHPSWTQLLQWIGQQDTIDIVSHDEWLARLEASNHPARALVHLWRGQSAKPVFDLTWAKEASLAMREVAPLNRERVLKIWEWIRTPHIN